MKVRLNGQDYSLSEGATLKQLIDLLGLNAYRVAVEVNLDVMPRDRWEQVILKEGDKVEVVHFVGGG